MRKSNFLRLNLNDILKSFLLTTISTMLFSLYPLINSGLLPNVEQLKTALIAGICAGLSYLIKNIFENKNGELLRKE